jgi:uncharacterized protein YdeI (YjbR/CyaY-like superfamily)
MLELTFETREDFRFWLEINHTQKDGIWLVYFKKNSKMPSISYAEAVEEALCFGWIDSKVQTIDQQRYRQVFTPRNPRSVWSELNKQRVEKMISEGKMTPAGMKLIEIAKKNGQWDKAYRAKDMPEMPEDFKSALMQDPAAWENYINFTASYRATYIYYVNQAKRPETRKNRIDKVVDLCARNIKPGMM